MDFAFKKVILFGMVRNLDFSTNCLALFKIAYRKDGHTSLIRLDIRRLSAQREYVKISGRGCDLELSTEAVHEGSFAISARNEGSCKTGGIAIYSHRVDLSNYYTMFQCSSIEQGNSTSDQSNPRPVAQFPYGLDVLNSVGMPLSSKKLRILNYSRENDDWYDCRFVRVVSTRKTGSKRVLTL